METIFQWSLNIVFKQTAKCIERCILHRNLQARLCGMRATHVYKDKRIGTWLRGLFAKYQTLCGPYCTSVIHRRARCLRVRLSEVEIKVLLRLRLPAATVQSLDLQPPSVRTVPYTPRTLPTNRKDK